MRQRRACRKQDPRLLLYYHWNQQAQLTDFKSFLLYQQSLLQNNYLHVYSLIACQNHPEIQNIVSLYNHSEKLTQFCKQKIKEGRHEEELKPILQRSNYIFRRAKQFFNIYKHQDELKQFAQPDLINSQSAFLSGVGIALTFVLSIVAWLLLQSCTFDYHSDIEFIKIFPLFRGLFLISLYGWMFTGMTYAMKAVGMSLTLITKKPLKGLGIPSLIAKNSLFSGLILCSFILWILQKEKIVDFYYLRKQYAPALGWLAILAFMFTPLKVFSFQIRFLVIGQIGRMLVSTLTGYHSFLTYYLGEQLTSCIYILKDGIYTICYYKNLKLMSKISSQNYCYKVTKTFGDLYLYLLLYGIKLSLCFHDWRHGCPLSKLAFKIAKYSSSIITAILSYKLKYYPSLFHYWLVSAVLTTLAHFAFDIKIDWLESGRKSSKEVQQFILLCNVGMRVALVMTLSPDAAEYLGLPSHLFPLVSAGLQIIRRSIWNFLMIENYQLQVIKQKKTIEIFTLPEDIKRKLLSLKEKDLLAFFAEKVDSAPDQANQFVGDLSKARKLDDLQSQLKHLGKGEKSEGSKVKHE